MRSILRKLITKISHIFSVEINEKITELSQQQEAQLVTIASHLADMDKYLSQRIDDRFYETQKMIDRFKSEVQTEINRNVDIVKHEEIIPQIVNQKKLEQQGDNLKLNIGCGNDIKDEYINIDFRALPGVDIVTDVHKMPIKENTVSEIYISHFLEHFSNIQIREILKYWFTLLKNDGFIHIKVPNTIANIQRYQEGKIDWDHLSRLILGGQDYLGDYHFSIFSPDSILILLKKYLPKSEIKTIATNNDNHGCIEIELKVFKKL